jgi:hypothetical protein
LGKQFLILAFPISNLQKIARVKLLINPLAPNPFNKLLLIIQPFFQHRSPTVFDCEGTVGYFLHQHTTAINNVYRTTVDRNGKHNNRPTIPRKYRVPQTSSSFRKGMGARGVDASKVKPDEHRGRKRTRSSRGADDDGDSKMGGSQLALGEGTIGGRRRGGGEGPTSTGISRSQSRSRHPSKRPKPKDQQGITVPLAAKARAMMKTRQRKMNILARAGESDRHIQEKKPKHLYSGKTGSGTRDRR